MTELPDEERAIVNNLSVQGLSIRLEYCFSLSTDSKTRRICRKANKFDNPQLLPQNSQIQYRSCWGGGSTGPKMLASCEGRINRKVRGNVAENLFQGTKAMLGKKVSHLSSKMSMQPLTTQYLPQFT